MALAAQAAYQFELDREDQYVTFSYWDSLHKRLLAGEGLMFSLNQLENAYLENNVRRLEVEKTVSILQEFPQQFLEFKWGHNNAKKGQLNFTLNEKLFDFDFPGHYCRKIKSISISIPAVIGPYQNINATLTQTGNTVVLKPNKDTVNYVIYKTSSNNNGTQPPEPQADTIRENWVPMQEIAVSKGLDDSGMFVLDFRDERYLPFEGTGAVSSWTLSLSPETNKINFDSISDVIINVKYTALDGGVNFASDVENLYKGTETQYGYLKAKCFDLKQAFAGAWNQMFITPPDENKQQRISFPVTDNILLPNLKNVELHNIIVQMELSGDASVTSTKSKEFLGLQAGGKPATPIVIPITDNFGELDSKAIKKITIDPNNPQWDLAFTISNTPEALLNKKKTALDETKLLNMALVIVYSSDPFSG